jgi:hypothetical protein
LRISHKNKFVFISKPKCGTTSVRKLLDNHSDVYSSDKYPFHHHTTAYELKHLFSKLGWDWNSYYRFATVRNPWDMIVSFYFYSKPDKNGNFWYQKNIYDSENLMEFNEWVVDGKKTYHNLIFNQDGTIDKHIMRRDFSALTLEKYIKDPWGNIIVSKVVKTEELNTGMKEVLKMIGLPNAIVEKRNVTKHKLYTEYYSKEAKEIIEKEFNFDIEFGEYSFGKK